jgi:DNA-binding transcriptional ArsR family regulator
MNNKHLGVLLMLLSVLLFIVGFWYVKSVESALVAGHQLGPSGECTHASGAVCPYAKLNELAVPKYLAFLFDITLFCYGLFLFVKKKPEELAVLKAKKAAKEVSGEASKVLDILAGSEGMSFQNELVEKTGLSKVKITRLLDQLESKGLVERRRRGMTNVVILKP